MSKVCQYATTYEKMCASMKTICIKGTQVILKKTITWTKKSVKRWQEWDKACVEMGLPCCKLKTLMKMLFASRVFLLLKTLEYVFAINICYQHQSFQL